jgi:hypothetical protein
MSRKEPLLAQLAVSAVLSATVAFAIPVFVDRTDYTAAVDNYARDRSPQNEATLRAERVKNQHIAMVSHLGNGWRTFCLSKRRLVPAPAEAQQSALGSSETV